MARAHKFVYWMIIIIVILFLFFQIHQVTKTYTIDSIASLGIEKQSVLQYSNLKEFDDCPADFAVPGCDVIIWKYPLELGLGQNCDKSNCSKCIPPNSTRKDLNEIYQLWHVETYSNGKTKRQQHLSQLLQNNKLYPGHEHGPIILMVFNYGFSYLFLNWACSLDYNDMSYIRNKSVLIVSDDKSKILAQKYDFNIVLNIHDVANLSAMDVTEEASQAYPKGTFKPLVTFQMIILSDLMDLGYDTMMMDIDIIFNKDPLKYIKYQLYPWIDIWTMLAPRFNSMGFANTGLIIMRSNCKTRKFMETMMKYITVILKKTDQASFNYWLFWKPFRQIMFKLLDRKIFIGGNDVTLGATTPSDIEKYDEFVLFHAYGTRDHFDKIYKFHQIDHWYFSKKQCASMFDETMIPDLNDRLPEEINADSSGYLLQHNLITDKLKVYNTNVPLCKLGKKEFC